MARGRVAFVTLPYSEVMCHMKIAGQEWLVEDKGNGMAQLLRYRPETEKHEPYSLPVTYGEAGVYEYFTNGKKFDGLTYNLHTRGTTNTCKCDECERWRSYCEQDKVWARQQATA